MQDQAALANSNCDNTQAASILRHGLREKVSPPPFGTPLPHA